jgi:hypothetical protein
VVDQVGYKGHHSYGSAHPVEILQKEVTHG